VLSGQKATIVVRPTDSMHHHAVSSTKFQNDAISEEGKEMHTALGCLEDWWYLRVGALITRACVLSGVSSTVMPNSCTYADSPYCKTFE
jgi:hypothetical protein